MKFRFSYLFLSLIILGSCSDTSEQPIEVQENQSIKLSLVKMSGNTLNSERSGSEMEWQEYYELGSEMRFTKVQIRDGDTLSSQGEFDIVMIESDKYLKFTHDTDNVLVGNCTGTTEEFLEYIDSSSLKSNWEQCDGPGLFYSFGDK
ncbi:MULTISPECIES: hypothetical protein [unclassified Leeuwenhoekiella]|uniref:hypothetical protein n=1 Tax=unclassified Leeuwenhoekiella TaxID=2615029 RepID=UPI00048EAB01|nr:hypothetical protein [Leeuwenhoekiella sp. MAR_2009_132]MDP5043575.1 hypothetical protein [Leeuwenhoekiella sp.]